MRYLLLILLLAGCKEPPPIIKPKDWDAVRNYLQELEGEETIVPKRKLKLVRDDDNE